MFKLSFVEVRSGTLYDFLKNIPIVGKIDDNGDFFIFGCKSQDEKRFYEGILNFDKLTQEYGFKTVGDVEEEWLLGDMHLYLSEGEYVIIEME